MTWWPSVLILLISSGKPPADGDAIERSYELGPVKATVTLGPVRPLIGDAVTLEIQVIAEPDVELLMPEFGEALERFQILDFVPRQVVDDRHRTVATQTYRLQPPASGPQAIPPILIEFVDRRSGQRLAPDDQDAFELLTERIEFEVESVLPENATAELKPPLGKLSPRAAVRRRLWPWITAAALILALVVPFVVRAWLFRRRAARRRSAYEVARQRLDRLLSTSRPDPDNLDAFYVELSGIVRRYLEDRFELRAPELTTEEFLEAVSDSRELSLDHQWLLREFLRQADLVKFAGAVPANEEIERSLELATRFLEETHEYAADDEPAHPVDKGSEVAGV